MNAPGRYLSAHQVLTLAEIVTAVTKGQKVLWYDGPTEMNGTLRGFTPNGSGAHFTGTDIRDAHVRITLHRSGGDVWLSMLDLMVMRGEGAVAFS
jgi:hypothetical protein